MTVDTLLIFSGAFVAILPFLGFPQGWDTILFFLAGIFVVALGIVVRRGAGSRNRTRNGESFPAAASVRHEEESTQ